ncbi:D-alanine--D-alanine ligase [Leucothrix pacifica]|uniref:D-alanine--D-alanine ligase n=1 Tax=Leucothrix pacifica TaxID=1247513 RepID=A0A317CHN0_9GAMM|nr:D-alanine--D-alanine ligase [Leucothrix pacifica]PWQ95772.1 D-alanine--D-alanine ligase [Leucothrix pacifica]
MSDFGKVAVLLGGWSAEREVSLNSGAEVLEGLRAQGVDAHPVDAGRDVLEVLKAGNFDRVFNILHGRGGEDGVLQGALELLQIPYTGCGVMASAISMDKLMTKRIWTGSGLATPAFAMLDDDTDFDQVVADYGLPLMVKPADEGSSVGMTKVTSAEQLPGAYQTARQYDCQVFAEQWVDGTEYTISIVGDTVLPIIRVETDSQFYDYEAKYKSDDTRYFCPCGLEAEAEKNMQQLAKQAFDMLGAKGWGRIDLMQDTNGKAWLIELNTSPGMTSHSLVPKAAAAAGISFGELVVKILETSR